MYVPLTMKLPRELVSTRPWSVVVPFWSVVKTHSIMVREPGEHSWMRRHHSPLI